MGPAYDPAATDKRPTPVSGRAVYGKELTEQAAEHAALLLVAAAGAGDAGRRLFGGLHDDEALAGEAHRERLTRAAAEEGADAELVGPVVAGLQAGRPADRGLRVDVGRLVDGEHDRGALAGDGDPPVA